MRLVIAPAGTKTAAATIRSLLQCSSRDDPSLEIKGVYRDMAKVPDEFIAHPSFQAVKGDISDASSLDFSTADVVLTLTPPVFDGRDLVKSAENVSQNVKDAIERASTVKRLVLLSSIGAHLSEGVGEIKTNNAAERIFSATKTPRITFVRCAYFMENWTISLETLKAPDPFFFSTVTPLNWKIPMVAVKDIGLALAEELTTEKEQPTSPYVFELHGPCDYSPLDVQAAFSRAMGKEVATKAIEPDQLGGFYEAIFPPPIVGDWVEMARSFLPGGIAVEKLAPENERSVVRGETELGEVICNVIANQ